MSKKVPTQRNLTNCTYEEAKELVSGSGPWLEAKLLSSYFPEESKVEMWFHRRWNNMCKDTSAANASNPYRFDHDYLLKAASDLPANTQTSARTSYTVSDFTGWIYDLYLDEREESKRQGKEVERIVNVLKKRFPLKAHDSDWELLHADSLDKTQPSFPISRLKVHGLSLFGNPDYVFEHKSSQTVVIVEVKASNSDIHSDGWPNLRAQLWAYGQIDQFAQRAKHIVLVGEIWNKRRNDPQLRQTITWQSSDQEFHARNQQLFEEYRQWEERCG